MVPYFCKRAPSSMFGRQGYYFVSVIHSRNTEIKCFAKIVNDRDLWTVWQNSECATVIYVRNTALRDLRYFNETLGNAQLIWCIWQVCSTIVAGNFYCLLCKVLLLILYKKSLTTYVLTLLLQCLTVNNWFSWRDNFCDEVTVDKSQLHVYL